MIAGYRKGPLHVIVIQSHPGSPSQSSNQYVYSYRSGNVLLIGNTDSPSPQAMAAAKAQFEQLVGAKVS
jgi:hypothetical protein